MKSVHFRPIGDENPETLKRLESVKALLFIEQFIKLYNAQNNEEIQELHQAIEKVQRNIRNKIDEFKKNGALKQIFEKYQEVKDELASRQEGNPKRVKVKEVNKVDESVIEPDYSALDNYLTTFIGNFEQILKKQPKDRPFILQENQDNFQESLHKLAIYLAVLNIRTNTPELLIYPQERSHSASEVKNRTRSQSVTKENGPRTP